VKAIVRPDVQRDRGPALRELGRHERSCRRGLAAASSPNRTSWPAALSESATLTGAHAPRATLFVLFKS
jgi:hypothetical protein